MAPALPDEGPSLRPVLAAGREPHRFQLRPSPMEGLAAISHLAPLALSVAPYLVAAHSLHKDADLLDEAAPAGLEVRSFRPLMRIPLPGWERRKLAVPPLLEVLDHCERERYTEIIISSPGPFGLVGVAAGRLLGIPVTGLYCTELPSQVRQHVGSEALEALSWSYLRWLFGHAERVYVLSLQERELLAGHGFSPARLSLLTSRRRMAA